MPKPKPPTKGEKPQRERFIDAAKKAEADESPQAFERTFRKVVPARSPPANGTSAKKKPGD